jgi:hypothetical protein
MKKLLVLILLTQSILLFSQERGSIAGTILDKEVFNEPLIYAEVHLKDTAKRVQTNFHGNFELTGIAPGTYTLVVDYLGYESLELAVTIKEDEVVRFTKSLGAKQLSIDDMAALDTAKEGTKISPQPLLKTSDK